MEIELFKMLVEHPKFGWVAWFSITLVVVLLGLKMGAKFMVSIAQSVRELKSTISDEQYRALLKNEADVSRVLRLIRHDIFADRILIIQFHNGVHSIAHNHLYKMTASTEAITQELEPIAHTIKDYPAGYLGNMIDKIMSNEIITIDDVDKQAIEQPENRAIFKILKSQGVESAYLMPMSNAYGRVFGFALIEYVVKPQVISDEMLTHVRDRIHQIGALLSGVEA